MANKSLGDMFSDTGRLALGIRHLDVQEEQNRLYRERSLINEKNDKLNVLMKLADDPAIRANPDQLDGVLTVAGQLAGVPSISRESLRVSRTGIQDMLAGLASNDLAKSHEGLVKAFVTFKPDDADRVIKAVENAPLMQERLLSVQAMRQLNEQKFARVHELTAQIEAGERPLTQAVTDFSTILHGTDTPDFRSVVKAAKVLQRPDGTSRADISALAQSPRTKLFQSQAFQQDAQVASQAAERLNTIAGETEAALDAHRNGAALPKETTKQDLNARLNVAVALGDAYTTLGQWANDPFNGEKLKAAKSAEKTIVAKRAEIEELKKTEARTRTEIAQDSLTFRQSEAGQKHVRQQAVDKAQNEFAQLPAGQQTPQQAGAIAAKYSTDSVSVGASDVLLGIKNPNKALVEIYQNSPGERKEIAEKRSQIELLTDVEATFKPGYVGPLDAKFGRLKSYTGLISDEEAEFRSSAKLLRTELRKFFFGLAQSGIEIKGSLEAIPDPDTMSDNQFQASLRVTKKNVQEGLKQQLAVMEQSGVKSPKPKPLDERYGELKKTMKGATERDIFNALRDEGYR
jgi:hypothetical protein